MVFLLLVPTLYVPLLVNLEESNCSVISVSIRNIFGFMSVNSNFPGSVTKFSFGSEAVTAFSTGKEEWS